MFTRKLIVVFFVLLLFLAGCSQPGPAPDEAVQVTPVSGRAGLVGKVVGNTNGQPIKETVVRLARVYHDPQTQESVFAMDLADAPGTFTDDQGQFSFVDLAPGEYVISVGDYFGTNDIVREEDGDAHVFNAEADKTLNVGVVQVRPDVSSGR
jgi:hypothetical protein